MKKAGKIKCKKKKHLIGSLTLNVLVNFQHRAICVNHRFKVDFRMQDRINLDRHNRISMGYWSLNMGRGVLSISTFHK